MTIAHTQISTAEKRIKGEVPGVAQLDIARLYESAAEGATLLAPNLRSARLLRTQLQVYAAQSANANRSAAAIGDRVLHWRGWTNSLWQAALLNGMEDRVLLQRLQERLLWEAVLDADAHLHRTEALTDLCIAASTRVYQHNAQLAVLAHANTSGRDDTVRFARWFREVQQRCEREHLLPVAALEMALAAHPAVAVPGPGQIVTCYLDALSPAQHALLEAVVASGRVCSPAPLLPDAPERKPPVLLRCADQADEWRSLALYLRDALQNDTRPNVAVIVPDLSEARDSINRTLREHLPSPATDPFREERSPLWEFSTSRPLVAMAVIADALRLLKWTVRELEAGEVSTLFRSPYLAWPVSPERAAELDSSLLRRGNRVRPTWTPRAAARQLANASEPLAQTLQERTEGWRRLHAGTAAYWSHVGRCRQILREFGWPGERTRSSEEFQAVQRWQTMLDALDALDAVAPALSWAEFLKRLADTARTTPFARENTGAPIQFLTPEESTGTSADRVWVAHADENRWSSHASAHPLLPWNLQMQHGMPGVNPARDQAAFLDQLQHIVSMAAEVTFSYAYTREAGEQRPCALVEQLPQLEVQDAPAAGVLDAVQAESTLEEFEDADLVPLQITAEPVAGGVSVLKSQAACAFRAFAERRLGSSTLESHDLGLDARDRGNVLHRALQTFWQQTMNRAGLLDLMATGRLDAAIHHAVAQSLQLKHEAVDRWAVHYEAIEQERLEALLHRWLQYESKRPDFTVESMEQDVEVMVGPLPLKVRVDRVDRVTAADGTEYRVIIDYKTGDLNQKKWEGERPEEPQLPLYAATAAAAEGAAPIGAIAFAIVRAGDKLQFQSLPRKSALIEAGEKANSDALGGELETWRATLDVLASDFAAGIASVGPKQYPATCKFCDQRLLCRLNPELFDLEDEPAEAEA